MSEKYINDELKIYRWEYYVVSKYIRIHQPTLGEICDYGEDKYYQMIFQLTATPQSMKWQLWEMGIDYTTITPYQLFLFFIYHSFEKETTKIVFGDLGLKNFQMIQKDDNSICLIQTINNEQVVIDEYTYNIIAEYIRKAHFIEKDERIPANNSTKMILIEDAKDEWERNKNKEYHSHLKNLISTMVNSVGFKHKHSEVWDIKINAFMDSVKRIQKIDNANLLLNSGYSGFGINLKEIDNKQLDKFGELV